MVKQKVVLVTGASRGIGKGIALAFAKEGAIVYFTGRTEKDSDNHILGGSLEATMKEISDNNGIGHAIKCDHIDDNQTSKVIEQIILEQGRIDILVNNAWNGYKYLSDGTEFWNEKGFWDAPITRFDDMFQSGVRISYVTSKLVVPHMIKNGEGIIFNLSFWAGDRNDKGVAYGMAKAATNKLTETMAYELFDHNISVITIYPGLVRTESVMRAAEFFDLSNSESTEFIGRAMIALASDKERHKKTGTKQIAAQVALDYNFVDIDGKSPIPLDLYKV